MIAREVPLPKNAALNLDIGDMLREMFVSHPELVEHEWIPVTNILTNTLHKYDLYRLRVHYTDQETHTVATNQLFQAVCSALKKLPYIELRGTGVEHTEYRILELPDFLPTTLEEAIEQIGAYRKTLSTWKDLGSMIIDLHGIVNSLKETNEDRERILRRLGMLAVFYRDRLVDVEESINLRKDTLTQHNIHLAITPISRLDPTPEDLARMVMNPDEYIKLIRLTNVYSRLAGEVDN